MADACTLVKAPEEQMSKFNERLIAECREIAVTSVQMAIVDGQPCVTLFSEAVEATEEDVEEAKEVAEEDGGKCELKVGDLIPSEEPVFVQVSPLHADNLERAAKSQSRMETLYKRAQGGVTAVLHATGKGIVKINDPVLKKDLFVEKDLHFAAVVYNPDSVIASKVEEEAPGNG